MDEIEQKIIKGVLGGKKYWLRKFQKRYEKRLLNLVLNKVDHYQDAEEIVQDTLLSTIYSLPSFSGKSSLWSWFCGIAKHEIADFYRKRKIKEVLFSSLPSVEKIASEALSPELALEEKEIKRRITHCFLKLTEGYREVLRLKYIEGLSLAQIASCFRKSVKAIEMRLRRARFAFRKKWHAQEVFPETPFTFNQRDLSFLEEYLGLARSSLSDLKSHRR